MSIEELAKLQPGGIRPGPGTGHTPSRNGGTSTPDETRASIERQTIVKAAISLYPEGLVASDADFFALLEKLEAFCAGTAVVPEVTVDDGIPQETHPTEAA